MTMPTTRVCVNSTRREERNVRVAFVPCHHLLCSLLQQVPLVSHHGDVLCGRAASLVIVIVCPAREESSLGSMAGSPSALSTSSSTRSLRLQRRVEKRGGGAQKSRQFVISWQMGNQWFRWFVGKWFSSGGLCLREKLSSLESVADVPY